MSNDGVAAGGVAVAGHLFGFGCGAILGLLVRNEVCGRIRHQADGSIVVDSKQSKPNDRELLEQALACQPLDVVVATWMDGRPLLCTACQRPLDLKASLGGNFVRCQDTNCGKIVCVDADLLLSSINAPPPESLSDSTNHLFDSIVCN